MCIKSRHRSSLLLLIFCTVTIANAQNIAQHPKPSEQSAPSSSDPPNPAELINSSGKRRQYVPQPAVPLPAAPVYAPAGPELLAPLPAPAPPPPAAGQCPGGPSLPVECDPKRPWPQCPPQSYCYATNSVDIGPYFCCPVCKFEGKNVERSTYGAAWRPATPFSDYVPARAPNWGPPLPPPAAPAMLPYQS
ncbi:hypothetical protein M3Y98_00580000 [Aphelenchoides besseyi]|nr:hypothetical protein M3Y98_00580000 [Aphelenchoides besseyi]KAI6193874.1 hypothetical protein M3Y96_01065000 [Aphelenchoides besseyi]